MWPRVLRFIAALVVAAFLWYSLTPTYDRFLAGAASVVLKADPRFREARLTARDTVINVASKDRRGELPGADIPAAQITYNVILLVALFASNRKPLRDRNVAAFFQSLALIVALHIAGVLLSIESTYSVRMGEWSLAHYGTVMRYFWLYAEIFYRLVGMFGAVFICWWGSGGTLKQS